MRVFVVWCGVVCVSIWRRIRSYDQTFCTVGEWTYNMHPSPYGANIDRPQHVLPHPHTCTTRHPHPHHIRTTPSRHSTPKPAPYPHHHDTPQHTHRTAHSTPPFSYLRETRVAVFSRHIDSDSGYNATPHHTTPEPKPSAPHHSTAAQHHHTLPPPPHHIPPKPKPKPTAQHLSETRVAVFSRHIDSDSASENFIPNSDRS